MYFTFTASQLVQATFQGFIATRSSWLAYWMAQLQRVHRERNVKTTVSDNSGLKRQLGRPGLFWVPGAVLTVPFSPGLQDPTILSKKVQKPSWEKRAKQEEKPLLWLLFHCSNNQNPNKGQRQQATLCHYFSRDPCLPPLVSGE